MDFISFHIFYKTKYLPRFVNNSMYMLIKTLFCIKNCANILYRINTFKINIIDSVQGGIALTSPPCRKKQTSGLTEKGPVRLSNELRNGCRKGGVVKK